MENAFADHLPLRLRRPARLLRLVGDDRLVALVRSGDEGAFEALYDRHHPAILGFCRHMLGTREEAEDAVQHTFLAAFRDLVGSEKAIDLRPWLFAIARNRCLSLLRARRAHVAIELAEPATDGLAATVERREDLRELLADLALLPEDQRAALLLAELGALDHAGIATVLDCPREKVKALVFQARTSLAASREARATPCEDIRVELATASGAALRRGPLRRHLRTCDGCRAFKAEVATQSKLMALALPVVPSVALKASVIAGSGGGASVSGGLLGGATSTGAGKLALSLAAAGAVAGGGALTAQMEQRGAATATPHVWTSQADPAPPISTGELKHHGAATWLSAERVPAAVRLRPASPLTLVRPAGGTANSPGIVAPSPGPSASAEPAPALTPVPGAPAPGSPAPATNEPPALGGTAPPSHAPGRQPSSAPPSQGQTPSGQGRAPHRHSTAPPSKSPPGPTRGSHPRGTTPPGRSQTPPGQGQAPPTTGSRNGGSVWQNSGSSGSHNGSSRPQIGGGQPSHGSSGTGNGNGNASAGTGTSSPGKSGASYGQAGAAQGQSGASQGQSSAAQGQSGASQGQSSAAPAQSGASQGQPGASQGQPGASQGQSGAAPGQSGASHGHAG